MPEPVATTVASGSAIGMLAGAGPAMAARRASANSPAVAKRPSGRLAMARATTASIALGAVTDSAEGGVGSVFSALCCTEEYPPENGFSPVTSWYSRTPAAQISARLSTVSPRSCSGAM